MGDRWEFLGGSVSALERQQLLFAVGGQGASDYPDLFPADHPSLAVEGTSGTFDFPLYENSIANPEVAFQYADQMTADQSSAAPQNAFHSVNTPSLSATSPKAFVSRPGIYEKRTDGEPLVYRELPSFRPFNQSIPAEATLEEICIQYPNHLRGSYLDAFIQYRWTATDMFTHLSDKAKQEFRTCGISRTKSFSNRANFLSKRLIGRLDELTAEEVTALCLAPKIRGCLMDGADLYGSCKLQGKFHNPAAPPVRTFPQRQKQARRGRGSTATAATKTFTLNAKEYRLWGSIDELDKFRRSMATQWDQQSGYAEVIVSADAVHRESKGSERNQLILQVANWPVSSSTETFFSFDNVENCPTFLNAINDMVAAGVIDMLSSSANTNVARQLSSARQAAVDCVLSAQAARLARLNEFVAILPVDACSYGVVDQALAWNGEAVQGFAPPAETQPRSQPHFGSNIPMPQTPAGANMFDAEGSFAQGFVPPDEAISQYPSGVNVAMSQVPSVPNTFDAYFNSMNIGPAVRNHGSEPFRTILSRRAREESTPQTTSSKRAREEPAEQTRSLKRARLARPDIPQDQCLIGGGNHTGDLLMSKGIGDSTAGPFASAFDAPFAMEFNTGLSAAPSLPTFSDDLEMGKWPVGDMSNTAGFLGAMPLGGNMAWSDVDMTGGVTPEGMLQQNGLGIVLPDLAESFESVQPTQAFSAADVTFTDALTREDLWGEFSVDTMPGGVDRQSNQNIGFAAAAETAQGGESSNMLAATEAAPWELPAMQDSDGDWLREVIYGPQH